MTEALPMFPLESVLLPGMALPLHIFEPRYRELARRCVEGRPEFGVVLIERGSEVGGGDLRTGIGTLARVREATELPDGRWILDAVGVERLRVLRWLPDDPYPVAEIEPWPEAGSAAAPDHVAQLWDVLRDVLALRGGAAELGHRALDVSRPPDDPAAAGYAIAALAPLGPLDRQRVLEAATVAARLDLLAELLGALRDDERARRRLG